MRFSISFLTYLLFFTFIQYGSEDPIIKDVEYVSLGWNCFNARQLRHYKVYGIRKAAYPFDWNQTSLNGLCSVLLDNFFDFFNPDYLVKSMPGAVGIFNKKYNITMAHDFEVFGNITEKNFLQFLPTIQKKYERRIKRLYNVCNTARHVYFFRTAPSHRDTNFLKYDIPHTKKQIERLRNILLELFPQKNWTLIASCSDEEYKDDWGMEQVKNFYVDNDESKNDFKIILEKLNII